MFVKFAPAFFQACPLKVEKSAHMSSPSVSHQSAFLLPQKSHTSHIHPQTFPTIFYYSYYFLLSQLLSTIPTIFFHLLLSHICSFYVFIISPRVVANIARIFPNIFYFYQPSHTCSFYSFYYFLLFLLFLLISLLSKSRRTHPPDISYYFSLFY